MEENIKVYVKVDSNNAIIEINSIIFIQDLIGWIYIDEGQGDKYSHAQGNYFPVDKGLRDGNGKYNYKLVDGKVVELTDEEKVNLFPTPKPSPPQSTTEEKLIATQKELDATNAQLIEAKIQLVDLGSTVAHFIDYTLSKETTI